MELTTYEAAQKYNFSTGYLRLLLGQGKLKGRQAEVSPTKSIWLIKEESLKEFLGKERPVGRKPKKKV